MIDKTDEQACISALREAGELFGTIHSLSLKAGVTPNRMYEVLAGKRKISPMIALRIEKATKGRVTRERLCPTCDWDLYP